MARTTETTNARRHHAVTSSTAAHAMVMAPTFVRTEMTAAQLDDPAVGAQLLAQVPLGRFATGEDVADAVVWACSERARMVTGTSVVVDGGWTAR